MTKTEILIKFNNILSSFLIQLSPSIGTTYNYKFEQIIKVNVTYPMENFLINVLPISDKIRNRDESYFNNTENHIDKIDNDETTLNEILRLKDIYYKLDEDSKSNIWDIFQALLFLGEEYIKLNCDKYNNLIQ